MNSQEIAGRVGPVPSPGDYFNRQLARLQTLRSRIQESTVVSTFLVALPDWRHLIDLLPVSSGQIRKARRVDSGRDEAAFNVDFAGPPATFWSAVSDRQYVNTYCNNNNR